MAHSGLERSSRSVLLFCRISCPDIMHFTPAVEISIITDSPEALLDMMNKSCVDLVYFMDKRMYDPKWVKILEEPENIIFVASPDHPCTKKKSPLTLNKIISEPFILTEKRCKLPFYSGSVSCCIWSGNPSTGGIQQYRLHHSASVEK